MDEHTQTETLHVHRVMPSLTVSDLQASLAWYRDILGFTVAEEYQWDGQVRAIRLQAGPTELMLGQDDFAKGRDRAKGAGLRLYCITPQDVDALAAAIQKRGGTLAQEVKDQSWGTRDFGVVDPDGFNISVTSEVRR
jgi:lactoylglutathione lyase